MPGSFETAQAVLGTIGGIVLYGRPDDYVAKRAAQISKMTPATLGAAVKGINPGGLTWVIVGDLSKIETGIRSLKLGDVKVVDADGKVIR